MTVLGRCATWGCGFSAVRRIEWKEGGGVFCEGCADVLVRAGDTDVTFRESLDDDIAALTEERDEKSPSCVSEEDR